MEDRAAVSEVQNTYVYEQQQSAGAAQPGVERRRRDGDPKIKRRNQFRTATVSAFPIPGLLPSQVLTPLMPKIKEFEKTCPPGYFLEFGGDMRSR